MHRRIMAGSSREQIVDPDMANDGAEVHRIKQATCRLDTVRQTSSRVPRGTTLGGANINAPAAACHSWVSRL